MAPKQRRLVQRGARAAPAGAEADKCAPLPPLLRHVPLEQRQHAHLPVETKLRFSSAARERLRARLPRGKVVKDRALELAAWRALTARVLREWQQLMAMGRVEQADQWRADHAIATEKRCDVLRRRRDAYMERGYAAEVEAQDNWRSGERLLEMLSVDTWRLRDGVIEIDD